MEQRRAPLAQAFTIGQLAKVTSVAAKTIRYYEQIGVLPTPRRTAGGYRQYDRSGAQRLRFMRRARTLGLSLCDVKTLIASLDGDPIHPCALVYWCWFDSNSRRCGTILASSDCSSSSLNRCCTDCGPRRAGCTEKAVAALTSRTLIAACHVDEPGRDERR